MTSKSQRVEVMTSCFKKLVQALIENGGPVSIFPSFDGPNAFFPKFNKPPVPTSECQENPSLWKGKRTISSRDCSLEQLKYILKLTDTKKKFCSNFAVLLITEYAG